MFNALGTVYQQTIFGTWGDFDVQDSSVSYLQTKARIGTAASDFEKRLAGLLRPVREVLPTSKMDFNQLLQRDLDDHRVASTLVKYILSPEKLRPVFFPPIVAALLPFNGSKVVSTFPSKNKIDLHKDDIGSWAGYNFGSAFKFERLVDPTTGDDFQIKLGRMSWNPEEAKLVVIDGQHRAMALLAIDRTINDTWSESGEKYKYFYEAAIKEALQGLSDSKKKEIVDSLEFPVTLIWFPDSNEKEPQHHEVARKLFVDINKNARTPSESRILLLSDNDLVSIYTRALLNEFRTDGNGLPIFAIEYDHPGRDQASSSKWSAISNVMILRDCVSRAIFGPEKYFTNLDQNFSGRESISLRGQFMRETLVVHNEIPEIIEDMKRAEITEERFPRSQLPFLQKQFIESWGRAIFRLLSEVKPYSSHGEALADLKNGWATGGSTDTLAKDAIFEGVGMYWTIRDAQLHWEAENRNRADAHQNPKPKTDIVKTWEVLVGKAQDFRERRAKIYLGKSNEQAISDSESAYQIFGTNACQLGLVLALRSLVYTSKLPFEELGKLTDQIILALNEALQSGGKGAHNRRLVFSRSVKDPLNTITKLDSPLSIYFRYFWLELLATNEAMSKLEIEVVKNAVLSLRDKGRSAYLRYLRDQLAKAIRAQHPNKTKEEIFQEARESSNSSLKAALRTWFGVGDGEWKSWISIEELNAKPSDNQGMDEPSINSIEEGESGIIEE